LGSNKIKRRIGNTYSIQLEWHSLGVRI